MPCRPGIVGIAFCATLFVVSALPPSDDEPWLRLSLPEPAPSLLLGSDTDADGVVDAEDNCPNTPNGDQADLDGDMVGDACDNCQQDFNPDQRDSEGFGEPQTSQQVITLAARRATSGIK